HPDRLRAFLAHHREIDIVAMGEGEVTFTQILRRLDQGRTLADVEGIAFRNPDDPAEIILTPPRPRMRDLDLLPSPFLDGTFDERTLAAVNRRNIKSEAFLQLKEHFSAAGAETYSEMILGLPEETYQSFCRGIVQALSPVRTDFLVLYLCRVLENTDMSAPEQ